MTMMLMIPMESPRSGDMKSKTLPCELSLFHETKLTSVPKWFFSEKRVVYKIHGGPMAGRVNYQTASYQCIRPGELWQCNWLEGRFHFPRSPQSSNPSHSSHTLPRSRHNLLPRLRHPQQEDLHALSVQSGSLGISSRSSR